MSRVLKYVVLAVVGFGLGAGGAWLQKRVEGSATEITKEVAADAKPAETAASEPTSEIIPNAPPAPTAEEVMAPIPGAAAPALTEPSTETTVESAVVTPAAPQDMPVAGTPVGGAFTLTDFNGQTVTEASWPGQYKMVFFGFSYCPDICPAGIEKMSAALKNLGSDAAKVQPLFITIDPARDTPEKLKEFFTNYEGNFVGLTGTDEQIRHVKNVYKAYAAKVPGASPDAYLMDHSAYVYFMSPDDKMLEIFGSSSTPQTMAEAMKGHLVTKAQ